MWVWVTFCVSVLFSSCKRSSKPQRTDFSTRGGVLSCFLRLKRYVAVANVVSRVARCVIQRHATLPQVVAALGCFHILRRTQEHANQMQTDPDCMRKQALNPQPIFSSFWELVFRRVHCQAAEMHHKQTQTAPISQLEIRARCCCPATGAWSSGMNLASGARGPRLNSRSSPFLQYWLGCRSNARRTFRSNAR